MQYLQRIVKLVFGRLERVKLDQALRTLPAGRVIAVGADVGAPADVVYTCALWEAGELGAASDPAAARASMDHLRATLGLRPTDVDLVVNSHLQMEQEV
jgi:hypothetical protein